MVLIATLVRASSLTRIYQLAVRYGSRCGLYAHDTAHTPQVCLGVEIVDAELQFELEGGEVVAVEKMDSETLQAIACCFEKYYA